jgi:hypothetical protein
MEENICETVTEMREQLNLKWIGYACVDWIKFTEDSPLADSYESGNRLSGVIR